MRTSERAKRVTLLGTIIVVFAACGVARAAIAYSYDLDSLTYMSTDIVRATIVEDGVRVEQVYNGKSAKGDVLRFDLSAYRKPPKDDDPNTLRLVVGDELVLFFDKTHRVNDTGDQWPVSSGVKLIHDGKVFSAVQWDNPGPYVLDCRPENVKNGVSLKQFESDLNASVKSAAAFQQKLSTPPATKDIPWLLEAMKDRSTITGGWGSRDHIGELLSVRLANLHDYDATDQAISVFPHADERVRTLLAGYGTPKGRDYMLKIIGDAKQPMKKRILYADGLWNIGTEYHRSLEVGGSITGDIGKDNGDFLKRIAQLTADNAADEPLCLAILRSLKTCASEVTQSKSKVLTADLTAALGVVGKQYKTSSQHVKFAIELVALRADSDAYKKLESPCGDVPFFLSPPSTRYTPSATPRLIFEYEYATATQDMSKLSYFIVLERLDGPERFEIPWKSKGWMVGVSSANGSSGRGSGAVDLPKDVPTGKYKVYVRMKSGDKTWVSYCFETQLPQPDAPQRNTE